jgi:Leucine-rich repeat (LRR) protein
MAEECKGHPLALKVIGRAMYGIKPKPVLQWELQLNKLRKSCMEERAVGEQLYKRLKLGYDILSEDDERLKNCFLYFAAFPEDRQIYFEDILWHWVGRGLVCGENPTADALSLLDKLRERSFIESHGEVDPDGGNLRFNVHDVIRDLAFYILKKDAGTTPVEELYLYRAGQNLNEFPEEWEAKPEAFILSLEGNKLRHVWPKFCAPKLECMFLGVNPIWHIHPDFFKSFLQLRVLDLQQGGFWSLPEALGDLTNLISLNLSNCVSLRTLPESVRKLCMLRHLDVRGSGSLKYLPSGMGDGTSLQVLNICSHDSMCSTYYVPPGFSASSVQILRAKNYYLNLIRAENRPPYTEGEFWTFGPSFKDICRLHSLTEFRYFAMVFPGPMLPHNISALSRLKILDLGLQNIETLPAEMGYWFIQLETLYLSYSEILQTLPSSFTRREAFPALINFRLSRCCKFVEVPEVEEGALPKLQTLSFDDCKLLQSLPLSLNLLTSLRELTLIECGETLRDSYRRNCEMSAIWSRFDIHWVSCTRKNNQFTIGRDIFF